MLRNKTLFAFLLWAVCLVNAQAQPVNPEKQVAPIDHIVAVVNDDVITSHELNERIAEVEKQLQRQGTPLPARKVLEKQLLERMAMNMLEAQYAKETGVRVDDDQIDKMMQRVAQQNHFPSVDAFKAKLEEQGVDFKKFREEIRDEIISARLREREVNTKIVITDSEINNYLAAEAKMGGNEDYHLAHIFIVIPEQASAAKIKASEQRAQEALDKLRSGADFAQVAAGYSDAKDALRGGDLGWHPANQLQPAFRSVLDKMKPGQITPLLRSPNGFHIIKLVDRRQGGSQPMLITQTHVRHILIRTSDKVSDSEARKRILDIKRRIEAGASFAEQARLYSQDGSASQGGNLGWVSPGETVPEFEKAMNALQPGEMSGPVQTGFGWHLIQVLGRRTADVSEKQKRQQARLAIHAFKSDEAWQDWLRQLRDRAYVKYELGDQSSD